ncbi:hypothetical protein PMAYCL1PPCAC_21662, partial [Pristionchus mayeri]
SDPYCSCAVDKFGFPSDWNYNDIWLDVFVILDTSEAMGKDALDDAGALIESFISDGFNDFLVTDQNAPFYTRVGVISMANTPTVLYNLNMTKADKVQGKASISKGVLEIDVVAAFEAALIMFKDGLTADPTRANARQVVYYMTDSDPNLNDQMSNKSRCSTGLPSHPDFLQEGEVELLGLKDLASEGYYFVNADFTQALQSFCKANCFCQRELNAYAGSDPAIKAAGGCYHPAPAGVPYNRAKITCSNQRGFLATIHDEEKGKFLQQLISKANSKNVWIGYEKGVDGVFRWADESTDSYTNWDLNQPNNSTGAKCAYVDKSTAELKWGAGNCKAGFPYVCQCTPCSVGYKDC